MVARRKYVRISFKDDGKRLIYEVNLYTRIAATVVGMGPNCVEFIFTIMRVNSKMFVQCVS